MTKQRFPEVTLNNNILVPQLGLGVWQSREGGEVERAIACAFDVGYRSIDTAAIYENERGVGAAISNSGISRDEIFVTSKVWNSDQGFDRTIGAFGKSLKLLGLEYLDLYLVHWPVAGKFNETWKALEQLYRKKKVRAIGVSNFFTHHLEDLLQEAEVIPAVNQIEFHPYLIQQHLFDFCVEKNISLEAWSPLMQGKFTEIGKFDEIALKYNKTAAQVLLRWHLQRGVIIIPKSVNKLRIKENAAIFDFSLSEEEMAQINKLDKNYRFGPDPDNFDF